MTISIANIEKAPLQQSDHSFCNLRDKRDNNVLRDSWLLITPENSTTRTLQAGYTVVYPGCRTSGHAHEDFEEIYHVTRGRGLMTVGDQEFTVGPGDTFLVPFGLFHTIVNHNQSVLEYFWVISSRRG